MFTIFNSWDQNESQEGLTFLWKNIDLRLHLEMRSTMVGEWDGAKISSKNNLHYFMQDGENERGKKQKITGRKEPSGWHKTIPPMASIVSWIWGYGSQHVGECWSPGPWQHKHHPRPPEFTEILGTVDFMGWGIAFLPRLKIRKASSHHPGNTHVNVC